jgi:hypothetical protein
MILFIAAKKTFLRKYWTPASHLHHIAITGRLVVAGGSAKRFRSAGKKQGIHA